MSRLVKSIRDDRGSALVAVFLVIIVLLVLGAGVMALSVGSARQSVKVDAYEKVYYPAEGASKQGVEYIRREVLSQYNALAKEVGNGMETNNNAAAFFTAIGDYIAASDTKFWPSQPDTSNGAAVSAVTAGIAASTTDNENERVYAVTSTAAGDDATRTVVGSIKVTFTKLEKKFMPFGDKALVVGDQLQLAGAKQGTRLTAPDGIEVDPSKIDDPSKVAAPVYEPPAYRDLNWEIKYTDSRIQTYVNGITPNYFAADIGKGGNAFYGFDTQTVDKAMYVKDASYKLNNVTADFGGTLICTSGALNINEGELKNFTIISAGDLILNGCNIEDSTIYCQGDIIIGDGSSKLTRIESSLVYSHHAIIIGRNGTGKYEFVSGLMYSFGDIEIHGNKQDKDPNVSNYTGQVISNGNTTLMGDIPNKNAMFDYSETVLLNIPNVLSSPFMESLREHNGGTLYTVPLNTNDKIFSGDTVAEN